MSSWIYKNKSTPSTIWRQQQLLDDMKALCESSAAMTGKLEEKVQYLESKVMYLKTSCEKQQQKKQPEYEKMEHDVAMGSWEKKTMRADGKVRDIYYVEFCISIDWLVWVVHNRAADMHVLDSAAEVVDAINHIVTDLNKHDQTNAEKLLRRHIRTTCKRLIFECGQFAAKRSFPEYLNTAASDLAATVANLLQVVKIKPSTPEELSNFYGPHMSAEDGKVPQQLTLQHMVREELYCSESSQSD
ncbi:hypothetical protein H634G_11261 [Metarhizium anisopliae BRIP 53293]|uniref:C3G9 VBS-like domain-containing protein n=1 Tax=Metarhizium anisopliae BRIP 53293 TaxID=1291518 RepID=A0A0D9NHN7_METAN|nr:hypothetical protein H634G_11261 [Metarhizium anisopliae BRIP 53293]KJK85248.1 hypothetical protein H633G_10916 [Metarhizium anisopliae BRIP 53284]